MCLLANTREQYPRRITAGRQDALEFTPRDDVKARTQAGKHIEYAEVGICLDREANQMWVCS